MKSRKMRQAGRAAQIGEIRNSYRILPKNLKGRYHFEQVCIDEMAVLIWFLKT
jgi:hypothetical protein